MPYSTKQKQRAYDKKRANLLRIELNEYSHKYYHKHKCKKFKQRRKISNRYCMAKHSAKARGYAFNLSLKQYTELMNRPCYYCGASLLEFAGCCLDRINNSYGYSWKNVLPACWPCNSARGDKFTVEEFKIMMQALLKYRKSKGL